jgi:[NiFe] hydrogenase diaphorase moiety large subunit
MLEAAGQLKVGACSAEYLAELRELSGTMQVASKCGLGQTSSNAFMSILEHFGDEITSRPAQVEKTRSGA